MKLIALSLATLGLLASCTYNISVPPEQKKMVASKPTASRPKPATKSAPVANNAGQQGQGILVDGRRVFSEDPEKLEPAKSVQLEIEQDRQ